MREKPTSIRFDKEQKQYLSQIAKAQKHGNVSRVVKRLVDREMGRQG
jgi:hypothetical protein